MIQILEGSNGYEGKQDMKPVAYLIHPLFLQKLTKPDKFSQNYFVQQLGDVENDFQHNRL